MAETPPSHGLASPDSGGDDRFRTIGEAAAETGVKPHILRYWEDCFPQLRPLKRAGGRRYYRRQDVALIRKIDDLVNRRGYTFAGARSVLAAGEKAVEPLAMVAAEGAAQPALSPAQREQLLALRGELADMLAQVRAA